MTKHWLPALLLLAGCANLPAIDAGVCGNGILEPGEDCDSSDPSCRACRIDCSPDQNGERRACPDGWACGSDAICRQASGDFVAHPATSESGLLGTAADFDGDGLSDVVTLEPGGVSVHYFDTSGSQASSANIAGTPSWPAVGSLTDDGRASLTLTRGDISVLRGKADRTLSPIAYAPFPVQEGLEGYVIMNAMPGLDYLGDEVLGILRTGDSESVWDVVGNQKLFNLPPSAEPAFLPIRAADLDPASPCDELVMAVNAASIHVIGRVVIAHPDEREIRDIEGHVSSPSENGRFQVERMCRQVMASATTPGSVTASSSRPTRWPPSRRPSKTPASVLMMSSRPPRTSIAQSVARLAASASKGGTTQAP